MGTLKALLTSILLQQTWLLLSRNSKQQSSSLHFNVTLKLIASNLTCNHLAPSLLCTLLEIELPRLIITDPNLTDVPEKFNIFQNFRTHQNFSAVLPPIGALRFSPHAENAFVDLQSSLEAVDITQVSQLGTEAELRACFEMQSMKVLKHKMGIVVDSTKPHHFTKVLIEKYIENSRESTVIPISVTNFRESNHDKFALLRRCRFIVQSYPTPYHVSYDEQRKRKAGLKYNILKSQADFFNFTFEYIPGGWQNIGQNPNGSWNGFIKNLMEDQIDVAMCLSLHSKR